MIERYRPKPRSIPSRLANLKNLVFLTWRPDLLGKVIEPGEGQSKVMWLNGNVTLIPNDWFQHYQAETGV